MKNELSKLLFPQFIRISAFSLACLVAGAGSGAQRFETIRSFGDPDHAGSVPSTVVEDNKGNLYGTTQSCSYWNAGTIFRVGGDGSGYTILHHFGLAGDGAAPFGRLTITRDGTLLGTTEFGGSAGSTGTVFQINLDGTGYQILHEFKDAAEGQRPQATILEGLDGALYGTTAYAGGDNLGTVFKLNRDGTGFSVLHSFARQGGDGGGPMAELIEGPDGALFGTAQIGGTNYGGTIFRINKDGSGYTTLKNFSYTEGIAPTGPLLLVSNSVLYGTTSSGTPHNSGTIFKINLDGSQFVTLHLFGIVSSDGRPPTGALVLGKDGALYGATGRGGMYLSGTVFKINPDCTGYTVLHELKRLEGNLISGVTFTSDGMLCGSTDTGGAFNGGTVFKMSSDAATFTTLLSFAPSGTKDGLSPGCVVEAKDGLLYGLTSGGGVSNRGSVFRLSKDGARCELLHEFGQTPGDGRSPTGRLVEGADGLLYGLTSSGGTNDVGTIFRLDKTGSNYVVLLNFSTNGPNGRVPAGLMQASDGAFYGTTSSGGNSNFGTVFRLSGNVIDFATLHHFGQDTTDGHQPGCSLIEGSDGYLYGTTSRGGYALGGASWGTVFRLSKDGGNYAILHQFLNDFTNGVFPSSSLIEGRDGVLYGTTDSGPNMSLFGTVYRIGKDGNGFATLFQFPDGLAGTIPGAPLTEGDDGSLYGTAQSGTGLGGLVFCLKQDGSMFTVLHEFSFRADGGSPAGGLLKATDHCFFGASSGGLLGGGLIFRMFPAQTPEILGVSVAQNASCLTVSGSSGCNYEISRSADLRNWTTALSFTMPHSGLSTNTDINPSGTPCFYRARWLP